MKLLRSRVELPPLLHALDSENVTTAKTDFHIFDDSHLRICIFYMGGQYE